MKNPTEKYRRKLARAEEKHLKRAPVGAKLSGAVRPPEKLRAQLAAAFAKAFELVFARGGALIEKTYDRDLLAAEFSVRDRRTDAALRAKDWRALSARSGKVRRAGSGLALAEGLGLGVLGVGLPDIPLFVASLLRGVYQIALSYGFDYDTPPERAYILRLLACAAAPDADRQAAVDALAAAIDAGVPCAVDLACETRAAADCLADSLLAAKFVQGLPLVGLAGGALNLPVYRRVTNYADLQYKKRYLNKR